MENMSHTLLNQFLVVPLVCLNKLGIALDRGERSFQLVSGIGDELILLPVTFGKRGDSADRGHHHCGIPQICGAGCGFRAQISAGNGGRAHR